MPPATVTCSSTIMTPNPSNISNSPNNNCSTNNEAVAATPASHDLNVMSTPEADTATTTTSTSVNISLTNQQQVVPKMTISQTNNTTNNTYPAVTATSTNNPSSSSMLNLTLSSAPQTNYSAASVLLLSSNGLLPTPGIGGPGLDGSENGLTNMLRSPDFIGAYDPDARKQRIGRFIEKRNRRVWTKKVKYDVRKNFADSRLRVKVCSSNLFFKLFYNFISYFTYIFCLGSFC